MITNIPYGDGVIKFEIPRARLAGILKGEKSRPRKIGPMISRALDNPLNKKRLEGLASGKRKILIVVPDATRKAHLKEILPLLLKRIARGERSIAIIVATGLHKRHNRGQLKDLLGEAVIKSYKVINHEPGKRFLAYLGRTKNGIPIVLNKILKAQDLVISIGTIEPHLYAGYSGGVKTVAIGLAGADTINATHGTKFLDDPRTKIGSIADNPFQDTLREIAKKVRIGFSLNIVNDPDGRPVKIFAGDTKFVFKKGVEFAKSIFEVRAKGFSDIVVCGVGYPKDVNLYQASRAINYVLNVDRPVLKKGGVLIVAAALRDGIGQSPTEKIFYREMAAMDSPERFIARIRRSGCIAGVHRAYMVARAMVDYRIVFVSKVHGNLMKALPFPYFADMREALRYAGQISGENPKIYVVPRALSTIPRRY